KIVESHSFGQGIDPGSESSLHTITTESEAKGLLIISYGMYVDPAKATVIDRLLNSSD
ncbi:MAG: hypothetical protein GWN00_23185, partial [Aliifodinibius sp.]|nr:hypothetical protein [Fodinibius sp.]NIY27602.1 hypothetical protein [Fodinibius sp.]